ncbi:hypothetical protein DID77_01285 [Candidatus Marinamargulisbacteria bacterium SCGC AG-439-L15]|nr:hypothetical protein DID77_01285 [Candidatus Marinamargulisbacteria bacterium SCGC AG-439-L15]
MFGAIESSGRVSQSIPEKRKPESDPFFPEKVQGPMLRSVDMFGKGATVGGKYEVTSRNGQIVSQLIRLFDRTTIKDVPFLSVQRSEDLAGISLPCVVFVERDQSLSLFGEIELTLYSNTWIKGDFNGESYEDLFCGKSLYHLDVGYTDWCDFYSGFLNIEGQKNGEKQLRPHGQGCLKFGDYEIEGEFDDGSLKTATVRTYDSDQLVSIYTGSVSFQLGEETVLYHGNGRCFKVLGRKHVLEYDGFFQNGEKHGAGRIFNGNSDRSVFYYYGTETAASNMNKQAANYARQRFESTSMSSKKVSRPMPSRSPLGLFNQSAGAI